MSLDPSSSSPKRKRALPVTSALRTSPGRLNTNLVDNVVAEEEFRLESPRTKVANRFENLQLNGTCVSKLDLSRRSPQFEIGGDSDSDKEPLPKRIRQTEDTTEIPETPQNTTKRLHHEGLTNVEPLEAKLDPVIFEGVTHPAKSFNSGLVRAYPSINRLLESKSRAPKKNSQLPISASADATISQDDKMDIDRASLTWHDDEITGHNPDDPDDDGEGINGIGFRPTPAMAHARAERRRQQLAEWKNREAREARAKRSERRRGSPSVMMSSRDDVEQSRKVRFVENTNTPAIDSSMTA